MDIEVVSVWEDETTEFTEEEFELIGEYFVQGFTMTTDAKDIKTDIAFEACKSAKKSK